MTPDDGRLEFWEVRTPELGTTLPTDAELVDLMASGRAEPVRQAIGRAVMTVRCEVEDVFRLTGRGPTTVGVLTEGSIDQGTALQVLTTGERVQVCSFDVHTQPVEEGLQVILRLTPEDDGKVTPGAVLISLPG